MTFLIAAAKHLTRSCGREVGIYFGSQFEDTEFIMARKAWRQEEWLVAMAAGRSSRLLACITADRKQRTE